MQDTAFCMNVLANLQLLLGAGSFTPFETFVAHLRLGTALSSTVLFRGG
jgi:hypothetical protein